MHKSSAFAVKQAASEDEYFGAAWNLATPSAIVTLHACSTSRKSSEVQSVAKFVVEDGMGYGDKNLSGNAYKTFVRQAHRAWKAAMRSNAWWLLGNAMLSKRFSMGTRRPGPQIRVPSISYSPETMT